jgi:hypothetical protein
MKYCEYLQAVHNQILLLRTTDPIFARDAPFAIFPRYSCCARRGLVDKPAAETFHCTKCHACTHTRQASERVDHPLQPSENGELDHFQRNNFVFIFVLLKCFAMRLDIVLKKTHCHRVVGYHLKTTTDVRLQFLWFVRTLISCAFLF